MSENTRQSQSSLPTLEEINDSPIEQVRLTVPVTDDPTMPALTFRTWVLGATTCGTLAMLTYTLVKVFYHRRMNMLVVMLLTLTSELVGYGFAGVLMHYLVDSPYMWWPSTLPTVSFFRALHEQQEVRPKGQLTRIQFLFIVFISSFAYYVIPNYFFPSLTALSFICWIWKNSVTAQQLGSGYHGLGLGSFTLDWSSISSFLGSPLEYPPDAIINSLVGFVLVFYVITPITYWTNSYNSKRFPIFSSDIFDDNGQRYNISRVLDKNSFSFDQQGYDNYSHINLSTFYAYGYGLAFASMSATLTHFALFYGRTLWRQLKEAWQGRSRTGGDIHNRLMRSYDPVPQWWFCIILVSTIVLSIFSCSYFKRQLQLPPWGVLLACAMGIFLAIPASVISATTGMFPIPMVVHDLVIGYLYPGRPFAAMVYKDYSHMSMLHADNFLNDFKLGHYMKIPPRSMFFVQVVGTVISSFVNLVTTWWILSSVKNICEPSKLPEGSPWTCVGFNTLFDSSIIWGVLGPGLIFAPHGPYSKMYFFLIIGVLAPAMVWKLSRVFPEKKWIKLINVPIIISATSQMPPTTAVNYLCWGAVGLFFNAVVYRKFKGWWAERNYILSIGLEAGSAISALVLYFALQVKEINGIHWWGLELDDHCPLAHCPTAPGVEVEGCPSFH
ncbi:oligopeptide transporter 1-like isoform X2 [Tasmannia lanceolata]|uniref:oligopeptide transporter 1-like isoform X2 n=1 Tax=Tasmannia lanceolata TaxID=3420 RepID=UPI0040640C5B